MNTNNSPVSVSSQESQRENRTTVGSSGSRKLRKREICTSVLLILCFLCFFGYLIFRHALQGQGSIYTYNDFRYRELNKTSIELVKYIGKSDSVLIPEELNGKRVTSIGDGAFFRRSNVLSVEIPDSVIKIGDGVFGGDSSLHTITVSSENPAFETIDGVLFGKADRRLIYCPGRESEIYVIPDGTQIIGDNAFLNYNCRNLKEIILPETVHKIGKYAFSNCRSLQRIDIPDRVTEIGEEAFYSCFDLAEINLPKGLHSLGDSTFAFCHDLKDIKIPDSVKDVGNALFQGCSRIKIRLSDNHDYLEVIDGVLFSKKDNRLIWCPNSLYGTYNVPDGTKIIGANAFWHCERLKEIELPDSLTEIQDCAFYYCNKISTIELTEHGKKLGTNVFGGCSELAEITVSQKNPYFSVQNGALFNHPEKNW